MSRSIRRLPPDPVYTLLDKTSRADHRQPDPEHRPHRRADARRGAGLRVSAAAGAAGLDSPAADRPGTGIAVIKVPARPFLRPVFERYDDAEEVAKRFLERAVKLLHGDFGSR